MKTIFIYNRVLFAILFLFFACKKELKYTRVAGKVINAGSKQPIDSVLAIIQDGVASDFFGTPANTSSDRKNYGYTDKNGFFDVELEGEHSAYIGFKKKENYYNYEYHQDGAVIGIKPYSEGTYLNEVFELEAEAWFNGVFINKQPGIKDSLYIYTSRYKITKQTNWAHGNLYVGKDTLQRSKSSNGDHAIGDNFFWFLLRFNRNKLWVIKIDSVYIKSFEIYRDTIYY